MGEDERAGFDEDLLRLHEVATRTGSNDWARGLVALFFLEMATNDTHGVMVRGDAAVKEVVRLGTSAWPNIDVVCRLDGPVPKSTLVTAEYAGAVSSSSAKRNWRGKTVEWSATTSDPDTAFVDLVRHCLRTDRQPADLALTTLTSMINVGLFEA